MNVEKNVVGFSGRARRIGPDTAQVVAAQRVRVNVEAILADKLLMTAFQPIVDLTTGRVVGVEALSRIVAEPGRTPDAWFRDAAQVGLGTELELLAVEKAMTAAHDLPEDLYFSINVSPATCLDDRLLKLITRSALDLRRFVLELTEHSPVLNYAPLKLFLTMLRQLGARIAVDDAGAGFASGQHILKVRPHLIKLDRGIVSGVDSDAGQQALAASVVALATKIGATVTAEGIETRAELRCVTELGAAAGQGYFFGRPSIRPRDWTRWKSRGPDRQFVRRPERVGDLAEQNRPGVQTAGPTEPSTANGQIRRSRDNEQDRRNKTLESCQAGTGVSDSPGMADEPGFARAVLDALPDATAVLDSSGTIIAVNAAWRNFAADNGGHRSETGPGVNYLQVCERSAASGDPDATDIVGCLRAVLAGDAVEREWEYPCETLTGQHWFIARFTAVGGTAGGAVSSHVDITRRKRAEQELAHRASHDPLTGLANSVLFIEKLTEALEPRPTRGTVADVPSMRGSEWHNSVPEGIREVTRVGLLYIDLDEFKPINDAFGHATGDQLLLATTRRLRENVRVSDTVARLGGDEFAICAPRITADGLDALAARIDHALSEPHDIHGQHILVRASIGVYLAAAGDTAAGAVHFADQAMYAAKRTPRSQVPLDTGADRAAGTETPSSAEIY